MKQFIVKCVCTGIYFIRSTPYECPWKTYDPNRATKIEDTEEHRAQFTGTYSFDIEFINV